MRYHPQRNERLFLRLMNFESTFLASNKMENWKIRLVHLLIHHEGVRLKPYRDTTGHTSIGVGRNLTDKGISEEECAELFKNDLEDAVNRANETFPWLKKLCETRRNVIYSMVFNLGIAGVRSFKCMIAAIEKEDYILASAEMLDSKWAKQVTSRAIELSEMMRLGEC